MVREGSGEYYRKLNEEKYGVKYCKKCKTMMLTDWDGKAYCPSCTGRGYF